MATAIEALPGRPAVSEPDGALSAISVGRHGIDLGVDGSGVAPTMPLPSPLRTLRADDPGLPICDVIAAWRAALRELDGLGPDDPGVARLSAEVDALRNLHRRLFAARSRPTQREIGDRLAAWSAALGDWLLRPASATSG